MKFKRQMINFKERLITSLQDQEYARIYLNVVLEEYEKQSKYRTSYTFIETTCCC